MYTIYCSHADYDALIDALPKLQSCEVVAIEPVLWVGSGKVVVKVGKTTTNWDIEWAVVQPQAVQH